MVAYLYCILSFTVYADSATCGWTTSTPGRYETLNYCWFDAGPTSQTLDRHRPSIGYASRFCWAIFSQQTRGVEPVLVWCWASVADIGSASRVCLQLWPSSEPVENEKSGPFLPRLGQCWVILPPWYNTDSDNAYFIYDYDRIYCFTDTTLQEKHDKKSECWNLFQMYKYNKIAKAGTIAIICKVIILSTEEQLL